MLRTIANAFSVADIRKKLAFTAAMLLLYRLGAYIPAPGVDASAVKELGSNFAGSNILGFLNLFSGGGLSRLSLFALGIMPYITASIILQLLTVVVPSLEKLQKEGEVGQQKITQYTRYLTVGLAFAQSFGYVLLFRSFGAQAGGKNVLGSLSGPKVLLIVICLTAGCTLLMWLGELITQRGVGNGISLMIFASIVSRIPNGIQAWWTNPDQVFVVMMPFIALAVIVAIVFVQEGQRRIPVQYAKRMVGRKMTSGGSTYLPLRVNMAGVIPVIFAASIMAFPPTIGQLLNTPAALDFAAFFSPSGWAYVVGEVFFIIIFTYFYTAVTFNPVDQADNLKKYGGFIPGVRPGRPTAEYLDRILSRLTFPGALYLGAVAALPTILISQTSANFFFGGTSILIVIGVALDTVKQLEAQLMMRNYEGFLK
jgi:preprotein translocase subunit SecY